MATKKPAADEAPTEAPVTPDELPPEPEAVAPAEPESITVPRGAVVRSLVHLDDGANTGKYYRPGDVVEGWDDETIARMVASGIVGVEE